MVYTASRSAKKNNRRAINIVQKEFSKGYISAFNSSRRPRNSLSDMTNMEMVEDNIARIRPPLARYGDQTAYTIIGRGKYKYAGVRGQLFMLVVGGVGKVYKQVDGGAFTLIGGTNAYDATAWAGFSQSKSRVYVYNGVDKLTFVDLATNSITVYTALATPTAPTGTPVAGLTDGTKSYNYYYKVTANNSVGESAASPASTAVNVDTPRDSWSTTLYTTVTWAAVASATSYTIYCSSDNITYNEVITLANLAILSFVDDGSLTLNPFKVPPASNSTEGPVFSWMYNDSKNAQIFGVGTDNNLYYSAFSPSDAAADFSALNGGGYVPIDAGGDTTLNFVDGFRTGKGDPVITVSSRGAAGKGKLSHVTFESVTYGDQVIFYPNVIEANGQSGTYAPRATVKVGDSIIYPTGADIKTTGTSQNINNIITTNSLGEGILPDIDRINLMALSGAAGVENQGKVYFTLPVGSSTNNEIWILDTTRKDAWTLRWTVAAKDIWLYEDNSGASHLCVLVNNVIMEFTRAGVTPSTDDGVAFSTRCAFSSLVWDDSGITLGNINNQFFKLLQPRGSINVNTYGLSGRGATSNTGSDSYSVEVSFSGIGTWDYSGDYMYGDDIGTIDTFANSIAVVRIRPKGLLNQEDWEIVTDTAGCDYLLSSVTTRGTSNTDLVYRGVG